MLCALMAAADAPLLDFQFPCTHCGVSALYPFIACVHCADPTCDAYFKCFSCKLWFCDAHQSNDDHFCVPPPKTPQNALTMQQLRVYFHYRTRQRTALAMRPRGAQRIHSLVDPMESVYQTGGLRVRVPEPTDDAQSLSLIHI